MFERNPLPVRGFLMHITHYDPSWYAEKDAETPFDPALGLDVIKAMAKVDLNLLVIDCADGVAYASHPELRRGYTVPMSTLADLAEAARERDIEVVPKLNFSQSHYHHHNDWFRPYHELFDNEEYWQRAFQLIDELIAACRPSRFFHIGMDEDHHRAHSQYVAAIERLHAGLTERDLRTIIWNDSSHGGRALVHAEKSLVAEPLLPRDIVQVPWDYRAVRPEIVQRLRDRGYEVWGAPGRTTDLVAAWRQALLQHGATGLLLTNWIPCTEENRQEMLDLVHRLGPVAGGT